MAVRRKKKKYSFEEMLKQRGLRRPTTEEEVRELQWDLERMKREKRKPFWRKKYPKGERYWMST